MKCDQCAKETTEGVSQDWIAGTIASRSNYAAPLGGGTVSETSYDNFIPITTFLCAGCYEPRAQKVRRDVKLSVLLGVGGIVLLAVAYFLLRTAFQASLPVWRNISGILAILVGFVLLKFAWKDLSLRGEVLRKPRARMELHFVLHPYALQKAREAGWDTVWDPRTFKTIASGNELERLAALWEQGTITKEEYEKRKKEILVD